MEVANLREGNAMYENQTVKKHAALVDRMATALGVDLEEEVMAGRLDYDALPDLVLRCTGCCQPDACAEWLDDQHGRAAQAPCYCRNAEALEILKKP